MIFGYNWSSYRVSTQESSIWEEVPYVIKKYNDENRLEDETIRLLFADKDISQYSRELIYSQVLVIDRLYSTRLNDYKRERSKDLRAVTVKDMAIHIYNNRQAIYQIIENIRKLDVSEQKYAEAYKAIVLLLQISFDKDGTVEKR